VPAGSSRSGGIADGFDGAQVIPLRDIPTGGRGQCRRLRCEIRHRHKPIRLPLSQPSAEARTGWLSSRPFAALGVVLGTVNFAVPAHANYYG
jgi:hypothetical protein